MKIRKEITCPLEFMHDILKGKWKMIILFQLYLRQSSSLAGLKRDIKGISEKMLLEQLKELQEYNIVHKEIHEGYPLKVSYSLTKDKGERLIPVLNTLQQLGKEYIEEQRLEHPQKSK